MTQLVLRDHGLGEASVRTAGPNRGKVRDDRRSHAVEFELVTSFDGFEGLEADWNALHAATATPARAFQGFNWNWHWCRHYLGSSGSSPTLAIVTGRVAGDLVLLMPLVTRRTLGLVELTWLGEPVSQYGDLLARADILDVDTLEAAWRFVTAQTGADVANLRRVRRDAAAAPLMARLGARITATEQAPFLDLGKDVSFEAWEARRRLRARKNRRRQARRLAEQGEVSFVALSGGEDAAAFAAHAIRLKRETMDDKGMVSPAVSDVRFERFFADAAHGRGRPAGVTVLALRSAGVPAALKIVIENDAAAFLHVAVYEPAYGKYGAGALLLEHLVERTIGSRRGTLDLLPPRHDYKMDFADAVTMVDDHALAVTAKGWIYTHGYLRLRRRAKALIEKLPAPARRAIARLAGRAG